MTVNIYIYQTIKGPGTRAGSYTYILEADVNGKVATLTSTDTLEPMTEKKAELTVILKALKRLVKDCDVMIVGCSAYLITAINQWLDNWENSNWKNAKGKDIANKEEWQELLKYIRKQVLKSTDSVRGFIDEHCLRYKKKGADSNVQDV